MYQVGLMETDKHVQYFWHALETFSQVRLSLLHGIGLLFWKTYMLCFYLFKFLFQDELRKFIKFACNQERIPFGHPCRDRSKDSPLHVPPYPMKIAPPDGRGKLSYYHHQLCIGNQIVSLKTLSKNH